jgi:hypothetical protein
MVRSAYFVEAWCRLAQFLLQWLYPSFETHRFASERGCAHPAMKSQTLMVRSASSRVSNHEATGEASVECKGAEPKEEAD